MTGAGRATVAFHGSTAWGEVLRFGTVRDLKFWRADERSQSNRGASVEWEMRGYHLESSVHAQRLLFLKPSANWLVMIRHLVLGGGATGGSVCSDRRFVKHADDEKATVVGGHEPRMERDRAESGMPGEGRRAEAHDDDGGSRKRLRDGDGDGDDGGNGGENGRTAATVTAARFSTGSNDSSDNDDGSDDDGGSLGGFYPIGSKRRSRSNSGLATGFRVRLKRLFASPLLVARSLSLLGSPMWLVRCCWGALVWGGSLGKDSAYKPNRPLRIKHLPIVSP